MDAFNSTSSIPEDNGQGEPQIAREVPPDPFDPAKLRLSQDFAAQVGVKRALLTVPVHKPKNHWFVQVHPSPDYRLQTAVIDLKDEREMFLVDRELWPALATEVTFVPRVLFTAITRQNVVFVWPVPLPGPDGKTYEWHTSLMEAAERAVGSWVRVKANTDLGAYVVDEAEGELSAPTWPDVPFSELLRVAFKNRIIDSLDHRVLRQLRGEI